ncbi:ankyrin repeat domain-containing protein [Azospirillum tabaci]|uniref:ankyrin repeat domain-containing protein n=1 Tax=Azospirillum tabaci TaxID=2752310 RepID=UPI00166097DD|nr:ankyrin repeat domain-containing protein [Azospirillum tabaci]
MDRSAPKATPSSNRSAAKAKPQPQAAGLRPDQTEVFDGLLLALLARKRLLVLVGEAGSGRAAVFHQLVEQVGSDGALVLPVAASAGAQVEDLVSAAGDAALPSDSDDRDFDTLIEELEERLDLAGTGLLAVENAGVLAAPTLADLIDLTRSETPSGRFLQVLLCGTPEMERTLARPGLAEAVRELGVIYRMTPGAGPSVTPTAAIPSAGPAAGPVTAPPRAAAPPRRAAERDANDWPANDWDAPDGWTIPEAGGPVADLPVKRPRRRAALAGAAITTLILLGAAGAGVTLAVPGATPERALDYARQGWQDLRSFVTERVHNPFADEPSLGSRGPDTLALARPQNPYLASLPAEAGVPVAGPSPTKADAPPPAARTVSQPAFQPSAPAQPPAQAATATASPPTTVAKLDPAPLAKPEQPPVAPVAQMPKPPVPAAADPLAADPLAVEHAPPLKPRATEYRTEQSEGPTGSATLPPLVDEPAPQMAAPAMPQPAAPAASAPFSASDNGLNPRVRTLVDQARRQIAAKLLTTPPNNNAYETVSRLREIAPATPEIQELLTTMEETYRRWASLAERDGNWDEARRFYERALIVAPNTGDLRDRIKAAGEGRALPAATASAGAVSAAPGTPPAPPATAEVRPGLDSRDGAIALMRRTDELKRALDGGADPNKRVDNGKTLLMLASEQGLTDAVRLLIDRRAKTELRTADGATAVMYAAWGGHEAVIHALAAAGAELDATNDDGKTALMAAAARGHDGVVKILVDRGVSVDRVASHGWSALMYAANNGHDRVARMLVERGANPFRMDTAGNSALTLGALQGHMQVVEALKPH